MKPKHVEKSFSCKRCVYKSNIGMKSVFDFCFVWPFSVSSSTSSVNNVSNIKYLSFFFLDQSFPDTGCCNWEIRIGMFPVWFCNFFRSWVPIKIVRCTDVFFFRYKSLWCPMILPGLIYGTGVGHDIKPTIWISLYSPDTWRSIQVSLHAFDRTILTEKVVSLHKATSE